MNKNQCSKLLRLWQLYNTNHTPFLLSTFLDEDTLNSMLLLFDYETVEELNASTLLMVTTQLSDYHVSCVEEIVTSVTAKELFSKMDFEALDVQLDSLNITALLTLAQTVNQAMIGGHLDPLKPLDPADRCLQVLSKRIISQDWAARFQIENELQRRIERPSKDEKPLVTVASFFRFLVKYFKENAIKLSNISVFMPATKLKSKKLKHPDGGASDTLDKRQKILDKVPKPPQPKAPQPKPSASLVTCNHCGRDRHTTAECKKSNFLIGTDRTKWYNNDPAIPYAQSKEGKDLLAKKSKYYIPKECKYLHNNHDDLIMNLDSSTNSIHTKFSPLTFVVSLNAFNGASKEVRAFADSGATSGSYASNEVAEWLADNGTVSCMCDRVICGAVGSKRCVHASCCHELNVTLHPDKNVNTLIKKTNDRYRCSYSSFTVRHCNRITYLPKTWSVSSIGPTLKWRVKCEPTRFCPRN